jgi:hypothetical protein
VLHLVLHVLTADVSRVFYKRYENDYAWVDKEVAVLRLPQHSCGRTEENHSNSWYGGNAVDLYVGVTLFKFQLTILTCF